MTPETREVLSRAFDLFLQGIDAAISERVNPEKPGAYIEAPEVARATGYSVGSISRLCKQGAFPSAKRAGVRGRWKVLRSEADAYFSGRRPRRRHLSVAA